MGQDIARYPEDPQPPYKKYILFAFSCYYPSGGVGDIYGSFDAVSDANEYATDGKNYVPTDTWYVIDRDTWKEVNA